MDAKQLKELTDRLAKFEAKENADKEKRAQYNKIRNAKNQILIKKAVEAGITVTDEEIDAELARK